jgi:hypothetical protein
MKNGQREGACFLKGPSNSSHLFGNRLSRLFEVIKRPGQIFCLAILFLLAAGCVANRPHRTYLPVPSKNIATNGPPCNPATDSVIETNADFKIGFVELDDQGWFWGHRQWKAVKDQINSEEQSATNGLSIVVFVHGWENNADYNCGNVKTFREVLTNLSTEFSEESPPRKVIGVYVGWRGLTVSTPVIQYLTFYNRKNTATRIGHQGSATQVFTELETMQDTFNEPKAPNSPTRTELIIIGHSFGGQLVYSAISQILIERLVHATHKNNEPGLPLADFERVRSLGDLVVLLNPAFEASQYNNLISLATSPDLKYRADQMPVLAILTSKTDEDTGFWFHLGMTLGTADEATRPSKGSQETNLFNIPKDQTCDEKKAIVESVGHDEDYINYDLIYTNYGLNMPKFYSNSPTAMVETKNYSTRNALLINNNAANPTNFLPLVFRHSTGSTNYAYILQPLTNNPYSFNPRNPVLNVAVDSKIMKDHVDIANTNLIAFLKDFIIFSHSNTMMQTANYPQTR